MEKSDVYLNTYVQYVEDFKLWVLAARNAHRLPENEILIFLSEVFREIYSRAFETLVDVMAKTRHDFASYRDIIEISERIKEVKKSRKIGLRNLTYPRKSGSYTKAPIGPSFAKDSKAAISGKSFDIKDVECFKYHKKIHYANMCPDAKRKDGKGFSKIWPLKDPSVDKKEEKSIR